MNSNLHFKANGSFWYGFSLLIQRCFKHKFTALYRILYPAFLITKSCRNQKMKQIFPIEIIENSIELHRFQHLKKSRMIYAILLLSISFLILLTLIVKIDLYATSPGVIIVDIHRDSLKSELIQSGNHNGNNNNTQSVNLNISTESDLIVECFVSPFDIALLKLNDPVNFQIKALHYDQWGIANGKIIQIDHQALMVTGKLKYKVVCSFHETSVLLKNIPVNLKTGMTLKAKFKIAKRTVFQLLFNKPNDWHSLS